MERKGKETHCVSDDKTLHGMIAEKVEPNGPYNWRVMIFM